MVEVTFKDGTALVISTGTTYVYSMARKYKWEIFVDKVVSGMSQREAYKSTFNVRKMSDAAIDTEASAMLNGTGKYAKNPKISRRYFELNKSAMESDNAKAIADSKEMQEKLTEIIRQITEEDVIVVENIGDFKSEARKVQKTAAIKDIISAINMLAKMQGLLKDNVNLEGAVGVVIVDDIENS